MLPTRLVCACSTLLFRPSARRLCHNIRRYTRPISCPTFSQPISNVRFCSSQKVSMEPPASVNDDAGDDDDCEFQVLKPETSTKLDENEKKKKEYEEVVEQVRLMNEYFSQYIEEYYEEEDVEFDEEEQKAFRKPTKEEHIQALSELHGRRRSLPSIVELGPERLVELLRHQRVKDIVCFQMPRDSNHTHEFVVICEPHNDRHAHSVIQNLRKFIKDNYRFGVGNLLPQRIRNGPAPEWFTIDLHTVNLHILSAKARRRYDLESLYAIDGSLEDENLARYPDTMLPRPTVHGMNLEVDAEFLPPPITEERVA